MEAGRGGSSPLQTEVIHPHLLLAPHFPVFKPWQGTKAVGWDPPPPLPRRPSTPRAAGQRSRACRLGWNNLTEGEVQGGGDWAVGLWRRGGRGGAGVFASSSPASPASSRQPAPATGASEKPDFTGTMQWIRGGTGMVSAHNAGFPCLSLSPLAPPPASPPAAMQ